MNLLITGAGLAGCHAARLAVQQGHRAVLFDMAPRLDYIRQVAGDIPVVQGDVRDLPALVETMREHRTETVFHSAYLIGDRLASRPYSGLQANVGGLIALAEAVRLSGVRRLVFASTYGVYNWGLPPTAPVAENFPVRTDVFYRASKVACESLLNAYATQYGFEWAALRFAQIYGLGHYSGGDTVGVVMHELVASALAGGPVQLYANQFGSNELVYVKDLARGIVSACVLPLSDGGLFNLGSGVVTDTDTLGGHLRAAFPSVEVHISPGPRAGFVPHRPQPLDLTRAKHALGYEPKYDVAQGIADFATELRAGVGSG